jgi:hypothetical protein
MERYRATPRGPQVHAVPDNEKYVENGKKLPWGYETISTQIGLNDIDGARSGRDLPEKGPFGRSSIGRRRGTSRSRSKTAEPAQREEDRVRMEQIKGEDRVFGSLGRKAGGKDGREVLGEVEQSAVAQAQLPALGTGKGLEGDGEATEVLLYGFGDDLQWAAIDFFERVSGGVILEDFEREPPWQRGYHDVARSYSRANLQKSLSKAALKKKNQFAGGNNWIKVTFNSRGAAELAIARAPHVVKGYLVSAEPWQGRPPVKDKAVPATAQAGAMIVDEELPPSFSTRTMGESPNGASGTLTSQTEQETPTSSQQQLHRPAAPPPWSQPQRSVTATGSQVAPAASGNGQQTAQRQKQTGLLPGATRAVLMPAESALMPNQPRKGSWMSLGGSESIGTLVPRKEDGSFDREKATWYWLLLFWIDWFFGTDLCGLKGDE